MYHDKEHLEREGFTIIENIFSAEEIDTILKFIEAVDTTGPTFRKTENLFAIRQFLKSVPAAVQLIFNDKLKNLIEHFAGNGYFIVKSIYFDKPEQSNWFVAYHQDLTISVNKKIELDGFGPWTIKQNQFAVQPTLEILNNNFTVRVHLDDTDENNGALRVIPKSHLKGIYRPENINWNIEAEFSCKVKKGGVMFMKPLLLHASSRTINNNKRRVIHIEFSSQQLPALLEWSEKFYF